MSNIPLKSRYSTWTNLGGGVIAMVLSIWPELASQSSPVGFILMGIATVINLFFQCVKQKQELPTKEITEMNQRGHHGKQKT